MWNPPCPLITIYAFMIYTAPCIIFWLRAYPLQGEVGGGWAWNSRVFWALWNGIEPIGECHLGPKKLENSRDAPVHKKNYATWLSSRGPNFSVPRPQSRLSARLFLQSSELGLPHPLTRRQVCPPPLGKRGVGESQFRQGDIHWDTLGGQCEYNLS